MSQNRICQLLKTEYPLIQGGMAWVANAELAAAVSNGGGLGLVGAGSMTAELLRAEIRKTQSLTEKPFGVNIMLMNPAVDELAQVVIDEGVKVVTTGAGSPGKYIAAWKEAGIVVIPVIPSVAYAKRMEKLGADAIVAEGTEAGGHIGELTTMVLIPQVTEAVDIPVIAAGGIADGRGVAAAFMLGAEGVQLGTRFLACEECCIHDQYKQLVVKARDIDTIVTGRSGGHPVRVLKNKLARNLLELEKQGASFEEMENITVGSLRKAVQEGCLEEGSFMAGQSAGLVQSIQPAAEIIRGLFAEAADLLQAKGPGVLKMIALVTGGSRGIGAAIARQLAAAGHDVVLTYRGGANTAEATAEATAELCRACGVQALAVQADIASEAASEVLVNRIRSELGPISILVNNAGVNRDGLMMRMKTEQFSEVIETNLTGAFILSRLVVPDMMKARHGRIINITSVAGIYGNAGQANYSAAKAGLIGLTKSMSRELGNRNITVNAVAPGFIDTDMTAALPEKLRAGALERISLGRFGEPADVAGLVAFLASDAALILLAKWLR